eukprot:TRINITY_DN16436_c0_g1_i1.p1 TRINITY_DN16436_c0_g1~~TRINITY_DN16436_c0_g1_i1.p1  ORF type:complete len:969 (+),score=214.36 TRINITY_DN16436_c0_g1_i1:102-3008(+)
MPAPLSLGDEATGGTGSRCVEDASLISVPSEGATGETCEAPDKGPSTGAQIRVAVRVRPVPAGDSSIVEVAGEGAIAVHKESATGGNEYLRSQQGRTEERLFDRVFGPEAAQAEVDAWSSRPLVRSAVQDGRNATIFVYGATGAGKTHTMFGEYQDLEQQGLIYRAVHEVFAALEARNRCGLDAARLEVKVSFLDIYNETVRDLFQDGNVMCKVLEDERRGFVKVANLREVTVQNAEDAIRHLRAGLQARKVEATAANSRSSRSHAVFSLVLERVDAGVPGPGNPIFQRKGPEIRRTHSRIALIDLAGSERATLTQNTGQALKDGAKINQSLLALANCIDALVSQTATRESSQTPRKKIQKPPYRDSKLTLLLKSSLTSDCLVSMIANVHPGQTHFEDTNNTLEYAKRASAVRAPIVRRPRAASAISAANSRPATPSPPSSPRSSVDLDSPGRLLAAAGTGSSAQPQQPPLLPSGLGPASASQALAAAVPRTKTPARLRPNSREAMSAAVLPAATTTKLPAPPVSRSSSFSSLSKSRPKSPEVAEEVVGLAPRSSQRQPTPRAVAGARAATSGGRKVVNSKAGPERATGAGGAAVPRAMATAAVAAALPEDGDGSSGSCIVARVAVGSELPKEVAWKPISDGVGHEALLCRPLEEATLLSSLSSRGSSSGSGSFGTGREADSPIFTEETPPSPGIGSRACPLGSQAAAEASRDAMAASSSRSPPAEKRTARRSLSGSSLLDLTMRMTPSKIPASPASRHGTRAGFDDTKLSPKEKAARRRSLSADAEPVLVSRVSCEAMSPPVATTGSYAARGLCRSAAQLDEIACVPTPPLHPARWMAAAGSPPRLPERAVAFVASPQVQTVQTSLLEPGFPASPPSCHVGSKNDAPWLMRLVEQLQQEKAQLDSRLASVLGDRRQLEAENARLRASNLEKDRQVAAMLARLHGEGTALPLCLSPTSAVATSPVAAC